MTIRAILAVSAAMLCMPSFAQTIDDALIDSRYCHEEPLRDAQGKIARRADVIAAFQRLHPCPSTGETTGACRGWAKDHVVPLAVGGCDSVSNLQWLPLSLKSCMGRLCKDRWERNVYVRKQP
jgi:hypothetical protein